MMAIRNCISMRNFPMPSMIQSWRLFSMMSATDPINSIPKEKNDTTHFGFSEVPKTAKANLVHQVFERVSPTYDLMNDVMSLGIHRLWKDIFVARLKLEGIPDAHILDVAGGTGDIAFRCLRSLARATYRPECENRPYVSICDINNAMLEVGRERASNMGFLNASSHDQLSFQVDDAQFLSSYKSSSFDIYTIAFGLRNVTDIDATLRTAYRVLKRGGRLHCLEFSHCKSSWLQTFYDMYSLNIIPAMGEMVAHDRASYQYLVESIRKFPNQQDLKCRMEAAGFAAITVENLSGGIAAIHSGIKL